MAVQIGMPVRIRDVNGNIFGGVVAGHDGSGNPYMIWANPNATPPDFWTAGVITIRDDTGTINNSWALVEIRSTTEFAGVAP